MTPADVTIERRERVAIVRFDSPGAANALSLATLHGLLEAARSLERDPLLCAVLLTGRPDRFSLGFDLRDARSLASLPLSERREALAIGPRVCRAWEDLEALTIAAIEGWCVGGGVALAASCDLRIGAAGSRYYVPELERGLNMSWGSIPRLVNLMGPARTKRLVMLAEQLSVEQAAAWGFVDQVTADGQAVEAALAQAERAARMPPVQLRMCKVGINAYANAMAQATSAMDRDQFMLAMASDDQAEAVAAFFARRPATFAGR
ncbi:MAG: enoyl-CoA hydratase/isomerase family protein [Methylophilaceae bacterium]|uniref:enoyl-CoA hydratase/isomerase family protein n=1 Tax=Methylibium sp. TaxID=2067992 RepID=UPI003599801E